jgi:hypothetical protein
MQQIDISALFLEMQRPTGPVQRARFDGQLTIDLGSGLIDHSQKMTTAAMHMADMNV